MDKDSIGRLGRMMPKETPPGRRLALENGLGQFQAHARWARKAIKKFKDKV
jgi:hypothetical protein